MNMTATEIATDGTTFGTTRKTGGPAADAAGGGATDGVNGNATDTAPDGTPFGGTGKAADGAADPMIDGATDRILRTLPLDAIRTDALPRDRLDLEAVASDAAMDELKRSIRARGQREPIEVWADGEGWQLVTGWRRLTALRQLHSETGSARFATVVALVDGSGAGDRLARYVGMVEENTVREDLSFAEMAQVAIEAAADPGTHEIDPETMVGQLYGALHRTKRSYIRAFVFLMSVLGEDLRWPRQVPRDLGADVSRSIRSQEAVEALRADLRACGKAGEQNAILKAFVRSAGVVRPRRAKVPLRAGAKMEFDVDGARVTAQGGECRIAGGWDFANLPRGRLEAAVRAFETALAAGPHVRAL